MLTHNPTPVSPGHRNIWALLNDTRSTSLRSSRGPLSAWHSTRKLCRRTVVKSSLLMYANAVYCYVYSSYAVYCIHNCAGPCNLLKPCHPFLKPHSPRPPWWCTPSAPRSPPLPRAPEPAPKLTRDLFLYCSGELSACETTQFSDAYAAGTFRDHCTNAALGEGGPESLPPLHTAREVGGGEGGVTGLQRAHSNSLFYLDKYCPLNHTHGYSSVLPSRKTVGV